MRHRVSTMADITARRYVRIARKRVHVRAYTQDTQERKRARACVCVYATLINPAIASRLGRSKLAKFRSAVCRISMEMHVGCCKRCVRERIKLHAQ